MENQILLSPLKKHQRKLPTPTTGRWNPVEDFLQSFSSDILIDSDLSDQATVHSVPTVFARPIQFHQALEHENHPAHRAVVGQWRGLLATFALSRWLNLNLDSTEFRLPMSDAPSERHAPNPPDAALLTILRGQLPRPASAWVRWWILKCQGHLLGATSPWSIVYTPAQAQCPPMVPWQRENVLIDPLDYYDPNRTGKSDELTLLKVWLDRLQAGERQRWGASDRNTLDSSMKVVIRELGNWRRDLSAYDAGAAAGMKTLEGSAAVREAPYKSFLTPLDTQRVRPQSDLFLDRTRGEEEVLVFSREGIKPQARVHGPVLGEQLSLDPSALPGPGGSAPWTTPSGREIPLPYLIAEEAFFPPRLARIRLSSQALQPKTDQFALPLTTRFFQYFGHEDLGEHGLLVEMAIDERTVTAQLRIPLKGGNSLHIRKTWDRQTEVVDITNTPGLAYWPNFVSESWKYNYAFMAGPPDSDTTFRPLLSDGTPLAPTRADGSEQPLRVWRHTDSFLGFAIAVQHQSGGSAEAGLILRQTIDKPKGAGPAWKVAVDFGTSNTHIMVREGDSDQVKPLHFQGRKTLLTQPAAAYEVEIGQSLFDIAPVTPPFSTLLSQQPISFLEDNGVASLGRPVSQPHFSFYERSLDHFMHNLKWAVRGGEVSEQPLRDYLHGISQAIACEAHAAGAGSLELHWSYPLALPDSTRLSMTTFWAGLAADLTNKSGLAVTTTPGISESEAICRFFSHDPAASLPIHTQALSIAVDIGGGSTDSGFWAEARFQDQLSFKLGGNDILNALLEVPGFKEGFLEVCDPTRPPEPSRLRPPSEVMTNFLLVSAAKTLGGGQVPSDPQNHPIPRAFASSLPAGIPPWSVARSLCYLFGTGVFFYLGVHTRLWLESIETSKLYIGLGGQGSALLHWIGPSANIGEVLLSSFREGLKVNGRPERMPDIELSGPGLNGGTSRPLKSEVARGLLAAPVGDHAVTNPTRVVIGEEGWRDPEKKLLPWDQKIALEDFSTLLAPTHPTGFAAHYLSQVVPRFTEELSLDTQGLRKLRVDSVRVQNYLRTTALQGAGVLQPIFATELWTLMRQYVDQYASDK